MIAAVSTSGATQALWYLTRSTGLVSLVLLTLVMALGISQVQRWAPARWPRFVTATLHRNASLLAVVFLAVHILTAVLDPFAPIDAVSAVVPFTSSYRGLWLGLGAVAFDLLVALVVTSLLRPRIRYGLWRTIHWAAYLSWPIAFVHGLGTGSDGRVGWVQGVDLVCLVVVLAAVGWRLGANWQLDPARRAMGALGSAVVLVLVLGWAATGPTQSGWAAKAGTPRSLLGSARAVGSGASGAPASGGSGASTSTASAALAIPVHAQMQGTIVQAGDGRRSTVTIGAQLIDATAGTTLGQVQIVLQGAALDDGGLALRAGTMAFGPSAAPQSYRGAVTSLDGAVVTAQVQQPGGPLYTARARLTIDPAARQVTGTFDVNS